MVNRLNSPIKTQRLEEWIKKGRDPTIYFVQYKHFRVKDTNRVKVNRWKWICYQKKRDNRLAETISKYIKEKEHK